MHKLSCIAMAVHMWSLHACRDLDEPLKQTLFRLAKNALKGLTHRVTSQTPDHLQASA